MGRQWKEPRPASHGGLPGWLSGSRKQAHGPSLRERKNHWISEPNEAILKGSLCFLGKAHVLFKSILCLLGGLSRPPLYPVISTLATPSSLQIPGSLMSVLLLSWDFSFHSLLLSADSCLFFRACRRHPYCRKFSLAIKQGSVIVFYASMARIGINGDKKIPRGFLGPIFIDHQPTSKD